MHHDAMKDEATFVKVLLELGLVVLGVVRRDERKQPPVAVAVVLLQHGLDLLEHFIVVIEVIFQYPLCLSICDQ